MISGYNTSQGNAELNRKESIVPDLKLQFQMTSQETDEAPSVSICQSNYHQAMACKKLQGWIFKGMNPILFFEDSNLNRSSTQNAKHNIKI